ncbi:MAG TPA: DUF1488 family protein, partial [Albitalea sp.]|nr:DUF1488 family protein [Albitalea sp.]
MNTLVEAINITIEIHGRPVRAVVTREVLEHLYGLSALKSDSMLEFFRQNQRVIEATIIDQ